jgi:hypothetical protein
VFLSKKKDVYARLYQKLPPEESLISVPEVPASSDVPPHPTLANVAEEIKEAKAEKMTGLPTVSVLHCDLIRDVFWTARLYILEEQTKVLD